jgi:valyl-tRNA synthetase
VRDEKGAKMSKSKGNIIDPLELIDEYGADALRFTLAALAAQGRDIKLSVNRVEGYRNFATKLWNAARFCEMNECRPDPEFDPAQVKLALNRWVVGGVAGLGREVARAIEEYRFNEGATALYQFIWGTFCDWYVEFAKPILNGVDEAARDETRATAAWALGRILHYLHPFMPFVSEELWSRFGGTAETPLITAGWPMLDDRLEDPEVAAEMDWMVELISRVRSVRAEMNVPPAAQVPLVWREIDAASRERLKRHDELIRRLARLESVAEAKGELPKGSAQIVLGEAVFALPLADVIDIDQERQRLEKEIGRIDDEIGKLEKKLANENFVAKAPPEVVEEQRERRELAQARRGKLEEALDRLA